MLARVHAGTRFIYLRPERTERTETIAAIGKVPEDSMIDDTR